MPEIWVELVIILALVLANGFFAGAEIAIIAARRARLQQLADEGDQAALVALSLANDPNRFLPTVQVGITLVGTLAAAYGGAHLEEWLSAWLQERTTGFVHEHAHGISLACVVVGISYLSVLLGELVPKRLALQYAASGRLARFVARPMHLLAIAGRPFVWFMGISTNAVLRLFGIRQPPDDAVSMEDIEHLIKTGMQSGVLDAAEQRIALESLRLGDRTVRDIMRPRVDLDALDVDTPADETLGAVAMAGMSRLPLYEGNLDNIIGFINIKDVLRRHYLGFPIELRKIMHPVAFVPKTLPLDRLLVQFQEQKSHLAIVLDEFGGTEGLVTLQDVLEELVGEIRDEHHRDTNQAMVDRGDGSWLVDGATPVDELLETLQIKLPDTDVPRGYSTVAGLLLHLLERIPSIGDRVDWQGLALEVVDMDGQRIDRVLVDKQPDPNAK